MNPETETSLRGRVALEEDVLEELEGQDLARIIPIHDELGLARTPRIARGGTGTVNKINSLIESLYGCK